MKSRPFSIFFVFFGSGRVFDRNASQTDSEFEKGKEVRDSFGKKAKKFIIDLNTQFEICRQ